MTEQDWVNDVCKAVLNESRIQSAIALLELIETDDNISHLAKQRVIKQLKVWEKFSIKKTKKILLNAPN